MKKCLLILAVAAMSVAPTAAFATFSVIQDSCRTEGNNVTTYFSVVNFNSPVPVCGVFFVPENPVPGCIAIGCGTPVGWGCQLVQDNMDYIAFFPSDCIGAGQIKRGFSFVLDPDFCCYNVFFLGRADEVLHEQEECFNCVHVGAEEQTWGNVKKLFR